MIVLHGQNPLINAPERAIALGPTVCLIIPDNAPLTRSNAGGYSADTYHFEQIGAPVSALDTLRSVILTLDDLSEVPSEPLVYLGPGAKAPALPIRSDHLEWTLSDDGDLESLVCGAKVTGADLFVTYFRNMEPKMAKIHTRISLELFNQYFGNARA